MPIAFIKEIRTNTVPTNGAMSLRLLGYVDNALGLVYRPSPPESPQQPETALEHLQWRCAPAIHRTEATQNASTTEKNTESALKTPKSTMVACLVF